MSSILKKIVMACTGLGLFGFLVAHLAGNLQLVSESKFNHYAEMLESNPLLIPAEIGLFAIFAVHVFLAIKLTMENKAARSQTYEVDDNQSTFASRFMWPTGLVIFFFLVFHIWMFKFSADKDKIGLWNVVVREFKQPQVTGFYIFCMLFLGLHISHGISSAIHSLGICRTGGRETAHKIGSILGWTIAIGFALLPLGTFLIGPAPTKSVIVDVKAKDGVPPQEIKLAPPGTAETHK